MTGQDLDEVPGVHRWMGVVGVVNRATDDGRVLAYDAIPEELGPFLKRGAVRLPDPATLTHLRHRPMPLPLSSSLGCRAGSVGEVDGLAMTSAGQIIGTGSIEIPEEAPWGATLLAGGDQPVGVAVLDGVREVIEVHRRPMRALFRRVTTEQQVHTGWVIRGIALVECAAWPSDAAFIRLVRPPGGPCS